MNMRFERNQQSLLTTAQLMLWYLLLTGIIATPATTNDLSADCHDGPCTVGQYLNSTLNSCQPCQPGTYMDLKKHGCLECKLCSVPVIFSHDLIWKNCTFEDNAVIECDPGYFRVRLPDLGCQMCSKCGKDQVMVVECQLEKDTVCLNNITSTPPHGIWTSQTGQTDLHSTMEVDGFAENHTQSHNDTEINNAATYTDGDTHNNMIWIVGPSALIVLVIVSTTYIYWRTFHFQRKGENTLESLDKDRLPMVQYLASAEETTDTGGHYSNPMTENDV